jgi:lipoprotein-releasing system ATP-binding protein
MNLTPGQSAPDRLVVRGLSKEYHGPRGPLAVLSGVSFELGPGEAIAVVGPSGAGKSTLLNIIGSLDRPTGGSVSLGSTEVTGLEGPALARFRSRSVGFIFQDHHLLPQLTALENVMLPMLAAGSKADPARARELLERVDLGGMVDSIPSELSGGERQRVAVARALVNGPPLVLCDEPTGNLDRATADRVGKLFSDLAARDNRMLLVVTHNERLAERFGRRMTLEGGRLSE